MKPSSQANVDRGGPAQPLLIVDRLRKSFGGKRRLFGPKNPMPDVVDGVSFDVLKGETLALVGESGCGKSTTARLVAHLIPADDGTMIFDGEGIAEPGGLAMKDFRRQLQMVFQDSFASLNPRLRALDAIAWGPRVHGVGKAEARERAAALLARVGLAPAQFGARYPHELSGGQRQRVNIARALAFGPRLLILDEAVAALDKSVQAQVLNLLTELKAEQALTYLFISHDLHVVHYLADRVLVMVRGRIVESAPVRDLFARARHPYTRALLAAIPSLDPARRGRVVELPDAVGAGPTGGCRFRDRCPQAHAVCAELEPLAIESTPGHWTACHLDDPVSGHPQAVWTAPGERRR